MSVCKCQSHHCLIYESGYYLENSSVVWLLAAIVVSGEVERFCSRVAFVRTRENRQKSQNHCDLLLAFP